MIAHRILLIFVDGVGIGEADPERNPFLRAELPTLLELTDGALPTRSTPPGPGAPAALVHLDAVLDTAGTPQSGTGQTALLTGVNAAREFGRHFGPWVPVRFRPLVEERSLLRQLRDEGRAVAFANAYPRGWPGQGGSRRVAAPPLAARGAQLLTRHEEALGRGQAVASGITNEGWRTHLGFSSLPSIGPAQAGVNLAGIAGDHDLTLFAHYDTDTAGHRGGMEGAVQALERFDAFLGGVMETLDPGITLMVVSDHGNIEDVSTEHTRNPALCLVTGPAREELVPGLHSLTDVTPGLLGILGLA